MDEAEWLPEEAYEGGDTIHKEVHRNGRTYQMDVMSTLDGRTDFSLVSIGADGEIISKLQGVVAREDLGLFASMFNPELEFAATWQISDPRTSYLEKMREVYPNHGAAWTPDQSSRALELYELGTSADEIGKELGRTPGGIRSQLRRLGIDI